MRWLSVIAGLGVWLAVEARAAQFRVTTWNLRPSLSETMTPAEAETAIGDIAEFLRSLNSDVLLLQEVRDRRTCESLVRALGAENYHLLVVSEFPEGASGDGKQKQLAILSKHPAIAAGTVEWKSSGTTDLAGGLATAVISLGNRNLGFYCVHLKNNATHGSFHRDNQMNIFKRELCAERLVQLVAADEASDHHRIHGVVLGGNFNTSTDQPRYVSEQTLRLFRDARFKNIFDGISEGDRITCPGRGRYPNVTFDYLFSKDVSVVGSPTISPSNLSDHFPVTCEIEVEDVIPTLIAPTGIPPAKSVQAASAPAVTLSGGQVSTPPADSKPPGNSAPLLVTLALLLGAGGLACWRWSAR